MNLGAGGRPSPSTTELSLTLVPGTEVRGCPLLQFPSWTPSAFARSTAARRRAGAPRARVRVKEEIMATTVRVRDVLDSEPPRLVVLEREIEQALASEKA